MKMQALVLSSLVLGFGLAGSLQAKTKERWVCLKDAAEVPVKGKKAADKKNDCIAQSGSWEKAGPAGKTPADAPAADKEGATEQSSGTGGAW